jgi:hypothetical protein
VTKWNEAALQAIRLTNAGPTIVARALAVTHTCMFDAWAAYDKKAKGTRLRDRLHRPANEHIAANKEKVISHAAYKCLSDLFPSQISSFNSLMSTLGYDPADNTTDTSTPMGIANVAAEAVLEFRHQDGSNQLGDLNGEAPYSDYSGYAPVNTSSQINDPNRWQPLLVGSNEQAFVTPHWGEVKPYALASGSHYRRKIPSPADYNLEPDRYRMQAQQIIQQGMYLTDEKKAIVEYWADGPFTETPPGHWTLFATFVSERDLHDVDQDVKMFFALTNAIFDASIVSWDTKRHFDYVRPITAIHFLFAGQTIQSWQGPVDGANWRPYFVASVVTPPFPEYFSGHSTFSAAGAETLRLFTGSDNFGHSAIISAGSSKVEPGIVPATDITLYWATFTDAADEAGISRRYGGIHFSDGDLNARKVGRALAQKAWKKTLRHFGEHKGRNEHYGEHEHNAEHEHNGEHKGMNEHNRTRNANE